MNLDRRNFIKNTAIASAAVMILPSCITSQTATQPKIGLGLYTLRNELAQDVKGTLEKVAKIGYQIIEPFGLKDNQLFGLSVSEFRKICDDLGLEIVSSHVDPTVFEGDFATSLEGMKTLGLKYAAWPWLPEERRNIESYLSIAETLNKCGELAKPQGIQVCYHNHDFEFFDLGDGVRGIDILANNSDPELVKLELDLYWVTKSGNDVLKTFEQFKNRVPLWHVKDMADTPEKGFAEVGEGTIDYRAIFAGKELSGMQYFLVEQDASDDPLKSIEISFKNLREKILA